MEPLKYKTVLVGLGEIARHHRLGLQHSVLFELSAVCDLKEDAPSKKFYAGITFYTDVVEMLEKEKPQVAILATPPSTHSALADICAKQNVLALIEKPLAATMEEVTQMRTLLADNKINIIYHWMFSQEILWFKRSVRIRNLQKIHFQMEDPYTDKNGHIRPSRSFLGGCWIDSGVNALSVLSLWTDLTHLEKKKIEHIKDAGIPVETHAEFTVDGVEVVMDISWRTERNYKETSLQIGEEKYVLEHSNQRVLCNGEEIFSDQSMDRLDRHYYNFYCLYPSSLISVKTTDRIHNILLNNI